MLLAPDRRLLGEGLSWLRLVQAVSSVASEILELRLVSLSFRRSSLCHKEIGRLVTRIKEIKGYDYTFETHTR